MTNIDVSNHPETVRDLMEIAELEYDPDLKVSQPNTTQEETS